MEQGTHRHQDTPPAPTRKGGSAQRAVHKAIDFVRVDTATDQLPIWAPSSYADELSRTYQLSWIGDDSAVTVQSSGEYGMLRTFDKLILTAIVQFWNEQGRNAEGHVYFHTSDLIRSVHGNSGGRTYKRVKNSLNRLFGCTIQYKNSFRDGNTREWLTMRNRRILQDLFVVEPKADASSLEQSTEGFTFAQLDFNVLSNLLGDFTRPLSISLLNDLSERGILFESYVQSVLYKEPFIRKDVFNLWKDLGLSIKGNEYGSQLVQKMKRDLDVMVAHPNFILGKYSFEKSKSVRRGQNLLLYRDQEARISSPDVLSNSPGRKVFKKSSSENTNQDDLVEWMRLELGDKSKDYGNLRRIAAVIPETVIRSHVYDAHAAGKDGILSHGTPTGYFIAMMKNRAKEMGIELGFRPSSAEKINEARAETAKPQPRSNGSLSSMSDLTQGLADRFKTGGS